MAGLVHDGAFAGAAGGGGGGESGAQRVPGESLRVEAGGARRFCERLRDQGVLCKETHTHTIRVAPPLVIDAETVDWAVDRFSRVLADA